MIALRTYSGGYKGKRSLRIWGDGSCKNKSRGLQLQDTQVLGGLAFGSWTELWDVAWYGNALAGFRLVSRQSGRLR
jgi:hypothetical protein